jgi:AraC family transcriptional regulator
MARASSNSPIAEDFSQVFPDPSALSSKGGKWKNVAGMRLRQVIDEVAVPALSNHAVLMSIGRPYRLEEKLGERLYRTSGIKGDVAVIPAGVPTEFRSREPEPQRVETFVMQLNQAFLRNIVEGADVDPDGVELVGSLGGRDPTIEQIGKSLLLELENEGFLGGLYADSLATALAVQLLRNHSSLGRGNVRKTEREPVGGLPKATLGRVTDYINDNLARDLTLSEIASVAHMSPFHFSRMFRLSTDLSPHQYVIRRRVERAKELLILTDLPLHEIARLSGFADQSHLAKHTRRLLGVTPRSLRLSSG